MLDARSRQPSFFDTYQICKPLFPPESFWHQFRELVYPLINDEDYTCMYCPLPRPSQGEPPVSLYGPGGKHQAVVQPHQGPGPSPGPHVGSSVMEEEKEKRRRN